MMKLSSFLITFLFSSFLFASSEVSVQLLNTQKQIGKNTKVELGVELPSIIRQEIENFVRRKSGKKINPFLDWEILVQAEFSHPTLSEPIVVDGFYFEDFTPYMQNHLPEPINKVCYTDEEYRRLGGFARKPLKHQFLVRFTPEKIGKWTCRVKMKTPQTEIYSTDILFEVKASKAHGFVKIDQQQRFLALDNQSFFPVGCNALWPFTTAVFDKEFAFKNLPTWVENPTDGLSEDYRTLYILPRGYESYFKMLSRLYDGGANTLRTIMYPSGTEIEWEELGNYTERLHMAHQIDKMVELAEEKDKFLLFNMQIHYSFQSSVNAYFKQWTWDKKANGIPFCYSTLVDKPFDFFSSEEAKKYYKQRLRYIVSRWGYSTAIAGLELFSEISNVGAHTNDNNSFYGTDDNYKVYENWQIEMGKYVKSLYGGKKHLLTSSYAGEVKFEDKTYFREDSPFDIASFNMYDFQNPSGADFWVKFTSERALNQQEGRHNSLLFKNGKHRVKPVVFSETGAEDVNNRCKEEGNTIELNRSLYQQLHSGTALGLGWSSLYYVSNYGEFAKAEKWINSVDLSKDNWHPGASKLSHRDSVNIWKYQPSYKNRMIGKNNKADLLFLRSGDKKSAFGVVSNLTYNVYTEGKCFDEEWEKNLGKEEETQKKSEKVKTYGRGGENLKVKGMATGRYKVEYFLPNEQKKPFLTTYHTGSNVKIALDSLGNTKETYIVLFRVSRAKEGFALR